MMIDIKQKLEQTFGTLATKKLLYLLERDIEIDSISFHKGGSKGVLDRGAKCVWEEDNSEVRIISQPPEPLPNKEVWTNDTKP